MGIIGHLNITSRVDGDIKRNFSLLNPIFEALTSGFLQCAYSGRAIS